MPEKCNNIHKFPFSEQTLGLYWLNLFIQGKRLPSD